MEKQTLDFTSKLFEWVEDTLPEHQIHAMRVYANMTKDNTIPAEIDIKGKMLKEVKEDKQGLHMEVHIKHYKSTVAAIEILTTAFAAIFSQVIYDVQRDDLTPQELILANLTVSELVFNAALTLTQYNVLATLLNDNKIEFKHLIEFTEADNEPKGHTIQ